jgi:hypothetical protein
MMHGRKSIKLRLGSSVHLQFYRLFILLLSLYCYYRYSALGPVWAKTRTQSGDWYGCGTLHPGQILRGSLPLLSPAFRRSHFSHQVPPRPPRRERSQRRKVELWARILSGNFAEITTSTPFRNLLHAANLRHGTDGFTSPTKEGVLRISSPLKIRRFRLGLNARTWVLKASTLSIVHRSLRHLNDLDEIFYW